MDVGMSKAFKEVRIYCMRTAGGEKRQGTGTGRGSRLTRVLIM